MLVTCKDNLLHYSSYKIISTILGYKYKHNLSHDLYTSGKPNYLLYIYIVASFFEILNSTNFADIGRFVKLKCSKNKQK